MGNEGMKTISVIVFGCLLGVLLAKSQPKVQVYTREPGHYGKENILICHVSHFQSPEIRVELLKNNVIMTKSNQTDLAFDDFWQFHITKSVSFKPINGETYTCKVTHMGDSKPYIWEADV